MVAEKRKRVFFYDWLRVLAVALLVPFHTGMIFVLWGFHIKNDELSPGLTRFNEFLNLWHMPLFMFLSGVGAWHALGFRSGREYLRERVFRLVVPLVFGMAAVVPPQVYAERLKQGRFSGSYFEFYPHAFSGVYPEGNLSWHHLWFLAYLLIYSALALPLFLALRRGAARQWVERAVKRLCGGAGIYVFALPFILGMWLFRNEWPNGNQNLFGDLDNFTLHFMVFLFGYALCFSGEFRVAAERLRLASLVFGLLFAAGAMGLSSRIDGAGLAAGAFYLALHGAATWFIIVAVMGYGSKYLDRGGPVLDYASEAALPFYILHQTVIVLIGFYAVGAGWGLALKFTAIAVCSYGVTLAVYEVFVRRIRALRFLFGMRPGSRRG